MIDKELLDILACPENKTPVSMADQTLVEEINRRIEKGELKNRGGIQVEKKIDGGLVRVGGLEHSCGQGQGTVGRFLAIEQGKYLWGDVGGVAAFTRRVGAGLVEGLQERITMASQFQCVDRATIPLRRQRST